jgi:HD-like signal output (HDOD) protein
MKHWNFPEKYSEIARQHHTVDFDLKNMMLCMVRLADLTCNKLGIGLKTDSSMILVTALEARELRLNDIDLADFEIYLEDTSVAKL